MDDTSIQSVTETKEPTDESTLIQLKTEIKSYISQISQNIIEIGKRLIQAKSLVKHGEWSTWLENNFSLSQNVAGRFMQVAERFSNSATSQNLNQSQMIALLSLPDAKETEKFIEQKALEGNPVENMTVKTIRKEIKQWNSKLADKNNNKSIKKENIPEIEFQQQEITTDNDSTQPNLGEQYAQISNISHESIGQEFPKDEQTMTQIIDNSPDVMNSDSNSSIQSVTNSVNVDKPNNWDKLFCASNELLQRTDLKQYIAKCASEDDKNFKDNVDNLFKLIDIVQDVLNGK